MNSYLFYLALYLFICTLIPCENIAGPGSCLPEGIRFTSQQQIDSFRIKFPNCTKLMGDLTIENGNITHLDSLRSITSLSGDLHITAENLVDLKGFDNLHSVSGDIFIGSHCADFSPVQRIVSLHGLNSLTEIGGNLEIINCNNLVNFEGLENLTTIYGDLIIWGNDKLETMDGLNNLHKVDGDLIIGLKSYHVDYSYGNPVLKDLTALTNLVQVGGSLQLAGNDNLRTLEGLNGLRIIGSSLALLANDNLVNLKGLDNLSAIGESLLVGTDGWWLEKGKNNSLTDLKGLHSLSHIGCDVLIFGGKAMTSLAGLERLSSLSGNLVISGEEILSLTGLESLEFVGGELLIHADALASFEALRKLVAVEGDLNISGCNMLKSLSGLFGLKRIGGSILIYDNYRLQTLAGLGTSLRIEGDVRIGIDSEEGAIGNKYLSDISSLGFLNVINGNLQICGNISLSSLAGLDRITEVKETLHITRNPNLETCNNKLVCEHVSSGKQSVIRYNASGCDSDLEILQLCEQSIREYQLEENLTAECFPNPSSGFVQIRTSTKSTTNVNVVNSAGVLIQREILNGDGTINLADYPEGLYFLHISNGSSIVIMPIVKNSL